MKPQDLLGIDTGFEVTPGNGVQRHGTFDSAVTPRVLHGDTFKARLGVCTKTDACCKIAGHDGKCSH